MNALLVVAHGSRRNESNLEVHRLTEQLRTRAVHTFNHVQCAFLEITTPNIKDAIENLTKRGASTISVFPYFLAAGTHVNNDLPRHIDRARATFPDTAFQILPHLGALEQLDAFILDRITLSE